MKALSRFVWPILLAIIGIAAYVPAAISFGALIKESGVHIYQPGDAVVTISKPGDYTLWYETATFIDGEFRRFPDDLPLDTKIKAIRVADSTQVPLEPERGGHAYVNGIQRRSLVKMTFSSPGEYRVSVQGLPNKHAFYLSESISFRQVARVVAYAALGTLCISIALILGICLFLRRTTVRKNVPAAYKPSSNVPKHKRH